MLLANFVVNLKGIKKNIINFFKRFDIYCIVFFAFLLRVFGRGSSSYGVRGELFRDLIVVFNFLKLGHWPLLGPSSSLGGFSFGAAYYYFLTPFVWLFNYSPVGATFVSLICSVASVFIFYHLLKLWFGQVNTARIGSFLLAASIFDIQNSYYISNPNLMPVFALGLLYFLTKIISGQNKVINYIALGTCLGIVTQLHATALLLFPLVTLGALITKRYLIRKKFLFLSFASVVICYIPYIIYELQNSFVDLKSILHLGQSNFSLLIKPASVISIIGFWQSSLEFRSVLFDFFEIFFMLAVILFIVFVFVLIVTILLIRRRSGLLKYASTISGEGKFIIGLWLILGSLMFLLYQNSIQFFYFLVLWPLPLILLLYTYKLVAIVNPRLGKVLVATFCLIQLAQLPYFYEEVYNSTYSHTNLLKDFKYIKNTANGKSYIINNQAFDVNELHYYSLLLNINSKLNEAPADLIFTFCPESNTDPCQTNILNYQKVDESVKNNMVISQYQRR